MDYKVEITSAAQAAGIEPAIAIAVAQRESGLKHFRSDGNVVTGTSGEIGIFQVKPATAPGVDLTDPHQNIKAGVGYLREMLHQFGTWEWALAAYNWGPEKVRRAMQQTAPSLPASVRTYVSSILGHAQGGQTFTPGRPLVAAPGWNPKVVMGSLAAVTAVYVLVLR
jgi:soluble lytic murein transglycosylase-like protein